MNKMIGKTPKQILEEKRKQAIVKKPKEVNHNSINLDERLTLKKTVIIDIKEKAV